MYCANYKKHTGNKNSNVRKTEKNRLMLFSNCAVSSKKKTTIIKNTELHNFDKFKMNKIINNFLLTGDKFMPELHLKHPGFTHSACGPFTRHREIIQKFKETGKLKHIEIN